ncbi:hypothetical protein FKOIJHOC_00075 [Acinetobacter phage Ab_121]|nr:hypothetical protein FKOIJHOC_00075 [Acinetobacter phage Ab_121]QQV88837.1 hypothetical protein Liucustia_137 [Acinetobacter phage Liucustia]
MSHFGIDPRAAKDFWSTDPLKVNQEMLESKTMALCEKFLHDMLLHDAYFYGLFNAGPDSKEYLNAFADIQNIARKYPVNFMQPRKMPDVGTIGHPEEPCLNELTRLIRGGIAKDELCVVVGRPTNASTVRPEVLEFYKSRRSNPVLHVALEDTKPYLVERYLGTSIK